MITDNPLFSIIVVSYNASSLISDTINSVLSQTFEDYEIIVKDACSTDDTIAHIPVDDRIHLFQSKDSGIYDGMNMAIREAGGRFLHFLNCGDTFASKDVLGRVANMISDSKLDEGIIYGDYLSNGVYKKQPSAITPFFLFRTPLCHQSMFFHRSVFEKLGLYDLNFRIAADYFCTVNAYRKGVPFYYLNIPVCIFLRGGVSDSEEGVRIKRLEYKQIHEIFFSVLERIIYGTLLFLSFRKLRFWVLSSDSPKWLTRLYYKFVNNIINR